MHVIPKTNLLHKEKDELAKIKRPLLIAVTGASDAVSYALLYMIAKGLIFGEDQPIILHLLESWDKMDRLEGVVMELQDCAFPLLVKIVKTDNLRMAFTKIDAAFLIGYAPPNKKQIILEEEIQEEYEGKAKDETIEEGEEEEENNDDKEDYEVINKTKESNFTETVKYFQKIGYMLNKVAQTDVKVLVLANPCNTNAAICSYFAKNIPSENFSALSRLNQHRARAIIASKLEIPVCGVNNVIVWGNHSKTLYPDVSEATACLHGCTTKKITDIIKDETYLKEEFIDKVLQREIDVIEASGNTNFALPTAKAAADHMHDWWQGTCPLRYVCMSVMSDGSYGVQKDIIFSFPVIIDAEKKWSIVKNLPTDEQKTMKLVESAQELIDEKTKALEACIPILDVQNRRKRKENKRK